MKCLIACLCVMALAALPAGASANTGSEVASPEPIVIAYIPEHLQQRIPDHQHRSQSSPTLPWGTEVEQVADASGGLQWDMWAPEPEPIQQPEFEVQHVPPTPEEEPWRRKRNTKGPRVFLISMAALTAAGGVVMGAGVAAQVRRPVSWFEKHPGMSAAQAGLTLAVAGGVGMIIGGAILGARKRQLRKSQREDYATLRVGPLHVTGIERTP
jgi:hypothetical protein